MSDRRRSVAVRALVVLASLVLLPAVVFGYVRRAAVDSNQFANRATAALQDGAVRELIGERVTDELVLAHQSDLLAARPLIQSAVSSVVGGRAFGSLFRSAVSDVHSAVFNRSQSTVTLTLADAGTVAAAALEQLDPQVAARVRERADVTLARTDIGELTAQLAAAARKVRVLAIGLGLLYFALAGAAVGLSRDRRRAFVHLGTGAIVVGALLVVGLSVARGAVAGSFALPEEQAAARAVWDAFLGDLWTAAWVLALIGVVVAASAASLLRPLDLGGPLRRIGHAVAAEPARPLWRVVRGLAFIAAGLVVLLERDFVISLALTLAGLYLIYAGVSILLRMIYVAPAARPAARQRRVPRRRWAVAAFATIASVLLAGTWAGAGGATAGPPPGATCNGHVKLCERRLNEVAMVATHNSMSVPLPGWFASLQDHPIPEQLEDGVRALMVDTYVGERLDDGRVRTVFPDAAAEEQATKVDGVSPEAVAAAKRLRDRLGFSGEGERGLYLCHSFCELGATALPEVLEQVHDFLVTHPDDVLVLSNQDSVAPEEFVAAVRAADLERFAYRGPVGDEWLTLREMIDTNQRVVFLAENRAGAAPWYHLMYEAITQETPFSFSRAQALIGSGTAEASCAPNRGPASAPLFLINHWVTTDPFPLPSDAERVNAFEPLLERVEACKRIRGRFPNLIAVNFYRRGDTFRVVDRLNGV